MADLAKVKRNVAKMAGMNAPESDIDGYIASEGATVDQVRDFKSDGGNFFQRVGKDYQGRLVEGQQAVDAQNAGRQGAGLTALDYLGKVGFGTVTDLGGEAFKSTVGVLPQGVKDAASSGLHYLASTPPGRTAVGAAQFLGDQYHDFAQGHPDAARHVEALANIGGVLAPEFPLAGKTLAGSVVDATKPTGKFLKEVGKDLISPAPSVPQNIGTIGQQAKKAAKDYYAEFDSIGGGLHPDQATNLSMQLNAIRPIDRAKAAIWDKSGVQKNVDMINGAIADGGLTFSGAQALRADLNSELKMAYRAGDNTKATQLEKVKETLTNALTSSEGASKLDVKAKNAWSMANHEFSKGALLEDLDLIASKASSRAQPANSIDTGINNFLNNKNASASLLPNEREALEDVTKKTNAGELLKSGGTRLMSVAGASIGGPAGFLVGHYGSMLNRTTAEAIKLKKLDKVYELINSRKLPDLAEYKKPLAITDQRRSTLERNIAQRRAYEASKGEGGPTVEMGGVKQLALPSPNAATPTGVGTPNTGLEGMTKDQVLQAIKRNNMPQKTTLKTSSVIRPPASQVGKLESSLVGIKAQQFKNMQGKLLSGEMSQNEFVKSAAKSFGLTPSQSISLAKEVKNYARK